MDVHMASDQCKGATERTISGTTGLPSQSFNMSEPLPSQEVESGRASREELCREAKSRGHRRRPC